MAACLACLRPANQATAVCWWRWFRWVLHICHCLSRHARTCCTGVDHLQPHSILCYLPASRLWPVLLSLEVPILIFEFKKSDQVLFVIISPQIYLYLLLYMDPYIYWCNICDWLFIMLYYIPCTLNVEAQYQFKKQYLYLEIRYHQIDRHDFMSGACYYLCDANVLLLSLAIVFLLFGNKYSKRRTQMNTWWQLMCFRAWVVFTQHELHPTVQQIWISKMAHISELWPYTGLMFCFRQVNIEKKKIWFRANFPPMVFLF